MRPVDVDWHVTGVDFALNARAVRPETNERDLVGAFGNDIEEVVLVGF
jgi:hypothetical protein